MKPEEFALLMQVELDANALNKGDWALWKPDAENACCELRYHFEKLQRAVFDRDAERIVEHAADVANICMKIVEMAEEESWS